MNYEKKYKEALEKARQFSERPLEEDSSSIVEYIFPELADSEDEKIRKYLLKLADRCPEDSIDFMRGVKKGDIIAWLEKQKKSEEMVHIAECKVWPANSATTANRQLYNRAILKILSNYVEKYPDIRFGQMLCNLDVKPHFEEESRETYCNLNETINKKS